MGVIASKRRRKGPDFVETVVMIWCPGCDEMHDLRIEGTRGPIWHWNGDLDKPSFGPSLLVRSGHYAQPGHTCWCTYYKEHPDTPEANRFKCTQCHSFIEDGMIRFLNDSTHALAGKTVPLGELPDWMGRTHEEDKEEEPNGTV